MVKVLLQNKMKEKFCIECTNGYQIIKYDSIYVEQDKDCWSSLKAKVVEKKDLKYNGFSEKSMVT